MFKKMKQKAWVDGYMKGYTACLEKVNLEFEELLKLIQAEETLKDDSFSSADDDVTVKFKTKTLLGLIEKFFKRGRAS